MKRPKIQNMKEIYEIVDDDWMDREEYNDPNGVYGGYWKTDTDKRGKKRKSFLELIPGVCLAIAALLSLSVTIYLIIKLQPQWK